MIHLFINLLASSAGGGLTYSRNVVRQMAAHEGVRVTAVVSPELRSEFVEDSKIHFIELEIPPLRRLWYEQHNLPGIISGSGADVLLSAGNFALRKSPVPQILLSRNSIYTSDDFFRDLRSRGEYRMWLDTSARAFFARKSIEWADITVAPSQAFAKELEQWTGRKVTAVYHGFDRDSFTQDTSPLPAEVQAKLQAAEGSFKLLFVSHYNYYRNFETLIRSLPSLRTLSRGKPVRLFLTCRLADGKNPGAYRPHSAARLVDELGVSDMVVELGTIPYERLHQIYRIADVYVTPAYTETFAHPLVEAMSSGIPIVASDIAVHREICADAGLYFDRFSPEQLANRVVQLAEDSKKRKEMGASGISRATQFSWKAHVEQILALANVLVSRRVGHAVS